MRSVDLALYADALAAEAAALARRVERSRGRLRQAAVEREAREALPSDVVRRLEALALLGAVREAQEVEELAELSAAAAAVEALQAWVEERLARAAGAAVSRAPPAGDADAASGRRARAMAAGDVGRP